MKRETLMLTLVRHVGLARDLRRKIEADHRQARHTFAIAEMMEGFFGVAVAALSVEEVPVVQVRWRSDMRVRLPVYEGESVRKDLGGRGYGLLGTSSVIDEAAEAYEGLVASLIEPRRVRGIHPPHPGRAREDEPQGERSREEGDPGTGGDKGPDRTAPRPARAGGVLAALFH